MAGENVTARLESEFGHEGLEVINDPVTGLVGAVAIHSTALGPAMGGVRLTSYPDTWGLVEDALRLSRAMTFKNAAADLPLGGGKAVLLDDGNWSRCRTQRFEALGRVINDLGGRYVGAEDVGTTPADMNAMRSVTRWVAGTSADTGGRGDPSAATAETVAAAIRSALRVAIGSDVADARVGVLGVGSVGSRVAQILASEGADVIVADLDAARARTVAAACGGRAAAVDGFLTLDLDVLAPCALGKVVNHSNLESLNCRIIAGAANNQLEADSVAAALDDAGVLYVPDFLANCGGIIHVGAEVLGLSHTEVRKRIASCIATTDDLLRRTVAGGELPLRDAYRLADERLCARGRQAVAA